MNRKRTISFASIQITSRCNLNCGFCFRRLNLPEVDTKTIRRVIIALKNLGVKTIIITGGEPLLRDDIFEIFHFIKQKGLQNVLQTNGLLLKKQLNKLAPCLDWISLSLDGDNQQIVNKMRHSEEYFQKNIEILRIIRENYKIKIKVGTVVTKMNYRELKGLGRILGGLVEVWKLYQFFPRKGCESERNKERYFIEDDLFNKTVSCLIKKYPQINIARHTISDYNKGPCLLIDPDGKTFISRNNGDFFVGNILDDSQKLIVNCEKFGVFDEIEKNFNKTYGLKKLTRKMNKK